MATRLENHWPYCLGCGTENPCSLGLVMYGEDQRVWGDLTIDERHQGAPGFAHGGAIATALDDALGSLLRLIEKPAVTVHLAIDYRRPWLLDTKHRIEAELDRIEDRKLFMKARALDTDGQIVAEANAIFLVVGIEHFMEGVERSRKGDGPAQLPW